MLQGTPGEYIQDGDASFFEQSMHLVVYTRKN